MRLVWADLCYPDRRGRVVRRLLICAFSEVLFINDMGRYFIKQRMGDVDL